MSSTDPTKTYLDLAYLAGAPEPTRDENRRLTLCHQPLGHGDEIHRFDCDLIAAWSYEGSAYELLGGRYEDTTESSSAWFEERSR